MSTIVAFSGGLDTSFCVRYLKDVRGVEVQTVTVNTGGFSDEELAAIASRSREVGADSHHTIDARDRLFDLAIQYLIKGNVLRGGVYPLCVGPDRVVQAMEVVRMADRLGASAIAHGSTGAGNDQIRFDVAMSVLGNRAEILAPIREKGLSRAETTAYLKQHGISVDERTTDYSINVGLWGTTVGGRETLNTWDSVPDEVWPYPSIADAPDEPEDLEIGFENGIPCTVDGAKVDPVEAIETLNAAGFRHAVGRSVHVGDTILGIKGRVAFQAPAAAILISAHRELEKIVLSRWQQVQKTGLGDFYGMLMHEAQYFDPVMRDIEAFLDSTQKVVTGTVQVRLQKGGVEILGAKSPFSLFDSGVATYGEANTLWDGRDAAGFARIAGVQSTIAARVRQNASRRNDLADGEAARKDDGSSRTQDEMEVSA
jgi:argininosuccinate synthase